MRRRRYRPDDPRRPVLGYLIGSRMVQKLILSGMGRDIARDPSAMEWLHRLRAEILLEDQCRQQREAS